MPFSRILACGCRYATTAFMLRAMRGLVLRHFIVRHPPTSRSGWTTIPPSPLTCCSQCEPCRWPSSTSHHHPGAMRQGRRPHCRRPRQLSPITGRDPPSQASFTTPRNRCVVRAAGLAGHRTPNTTQHYAKFTLNTLSKAYFEAGYFTRNVRAIEVLIDRDAAPPERPPPANPGNTTTSATAGAHTASSSSARAEWLASVVVSTPQGQQLSSRMTPL
jgi:hypothetical protein